MADKGEILKIYTKFRIKQSEILERLITTKEDYTKDDLQKEISDDEEAKELLREIQLIVKR